MAAEVEKSIPDPNMVGCAFVEQYYPLLHSNPEMAYKFYQDTSVIGRPGLNGVMSSVSNMDGINNMIISQEYKNCDIELQNIDCQGSYGNGVLVLVTGLFARNGNMKRKFTQLFFLAPQENKTYFVLNDIFRFLDDPNLPNMKTIDTAPTAPVTPDPELPVVSDDSVLDQETTSLQEDNDIPKDSSHPLENGTIPIVDKEVVDNLVVPSQSDSLPSSVGTSQNDATPISDVAASTVQEDAPRRTYASVANELNFKLQPFQQKVSPPKPMQMPRAIVAPEASPRPVSSSNVVEKSNKQTGNKGHSIFVANLPMEATEEQLFEAFKQFGPIKPKGIQVRSYERERNCFGFVEFESAESMQSALAVSTIMIGGRKAHIEEKKANNDGGKYPSRRGGFRNDSFRNRGGGRGYGRNEFENQGQSENNSRRRGEKFNQNGGGRVAGQGQGQSHAKAEGTASGAI